MAKSAPVSQALYRKYRPTKLSDVVGQSQVTDTLEQALKQGKIAHAYLFIGPRGTGKTSVARIFAHVVNGFKYELEDHYLDIIEIDAASNTGVDNIRELREKAAIAPTKGKYKVYIIDEVHMLSKSAANALLKTLEEPPKHVIFILATTDAHKVPITISSRTQSFSFKLADPETMQQHLRKIAQNEHIPITDEALALLVRRGGGSFRDSLSLLDQISTLSDQEITATSLEKALGMPQSQTIHALISAYIANDFSVLHQLLQQLLNTGIKPEIIASELITTILEQPNPQVLPLLKALTNVQAPFPEAKLTLALLEIATLPSKPPVNPSLSPARALPRAPKPQPESHPTPNKTPLESPQNRPKTAPEAVSSRQTTSESLQNRPKTAPEAVSPRQTAPNTNLSFDWQTFLSQVPETNLGLLKQLQKVSYEFKDGILHLYPDCKFNKDVLERPTNHQILQKILPDIKLIVHEPGSQPIATEDPALSQISAIMGNIQAVSDDSPF